MISEERIAVFIRSFERPKSQLMEEIRKEARAQGVPIIRPETEPLLSFFAGLLKPERILAVGTAVGYSALLLREASPKGVKITTIENYAPRIEKALENFRRAGAEGEITLLQGDADELLKTLQERYDLIFMDAAKAQYIHWLPEVKRLMHAGSVLISDNILQEGDILESKFAVERRDRTIHKRMREYLYELTHDPGLETVILPLGDGVSVTMKKERNDEET